MDSLRCGEELFNFAQVYADFQASCLSLVSDRKENSDYDSDDLLDQLDDNADNEILSLREGIKESAVHADDKTLNEDSKGSSFSDVLDILCNPKFQLTDAFSELCKVYTLAVAVALVRVLPNAVSLH